MPPGAVTVTSTAPTEPAGAVAVIVVALVTLNEDAGLPPMVTEVAPVKLVPVMVSEVPPTIGPAVGEIPVIVGNAAKVYWSADDFADVPPRVVMVMSTDPAEQPGAVAVIELALLTVYKVAAVVPNFTVVAPLMFIPVMVTVVPPTIGPAVGEIPVTVGGVNNGFRIWNVFC